MLNNTEYKSEISDVIEVVDDQIVTQLSIAQNAAANSPDFNKSVRAARSIRRERRYNQGAASRRWRVSLW